MVLGQVKREGGPVLERIFWPQTASLGALCVLEETMASFFVLGLFTVTPSGTQLSIKQLTWF